MNKELIVNTLKNYSPNGNVPAPVKIRRVKLRDFAKHLAAAKNDIYHAITEDINRPAIDTLMSELIPLNDIVHFLASKLKKLTRPEHLPGSPATFPASAKLVKEPYGTVLVISTWNYPLLLTLEPAIAAYAAGNRVVLKLSPRSPHCNQTVKNLLAKCFSSDEILVIDNELSLDETLSYRYDYIFMTGSSPSGRNVLKKAAENLTPCTLELGGKNPCIVSTGADLKIAARRIVWGKFFNAGQSCAAPDFLYIHTSLKSELMNLIASEIQRMYGRNPLDGQFPSMPDNEAYSRMVKLASEGRLITGGDKFPQQRSIEPTVIDMVGDDSPLFKEEIFGPILPVKTFHTEDEAMVFLNHSERPLAAYCFGGSSRFKKQLQENFSCGALVFNDVLIHFSNMNIPFGGVGKSGFGSYHGSRSFKTFVHEKPVVKQTVLFDLPFRYPPHAGFMRKLLEFFCRLK